MNKYRILIVIGVAALVIGRLISPVVIHAQDDEGDGIRDQIRIMTQIIEASLGKDAIDRRLHLSVFDSRIRAEYIPTVGAIFTIPITFPLHPSQDEKGNGTEDAVEEDLWEHFSSASERASKAAGPALSPVEPVEPLKIHVKIDKEQIEKEVRYRAQAEGFKANTYAVAAQDLLVSVQDGFSWNVSIGNSKPYDPVKVSTLTRTIIETIAQYGHRLKSLPNSERVLVVLEAPRPRGSAVHVVFMEVDENVVYTPEHRAREIVKETKKVVRRELEEVRERNKQIRIVRDRGLTYWTPGVLGQVDRDHRLLAFKKSDLQQERSYDSMKGKVETTDY